jgi:hypothetical protein
MNTSHIIGAFSPCRGEEIKCNSEAILCYRMWLHYLGPLQDSGASYCGFPRKGSACYRVVKRPGHGGMSAAHSEHGSANQCLRKALQVGGEALPLVRLNGQDGVRAPDGNQ